MMSFRWIHGGKAAVASHSPTQAGTVAESGSCGAGWTSPAIYSTVMDLRTALPSEHPIAPKTRQDTTESYPSSDSTTEDSPLHTGQAPSGQRNHMTEIACEAAMKITLEPSSCSSALSSSRSGSSSNSSSRDGKCKQASKECSTTGTVGKKLSHAVGLHRDVSG